MSIQIPATIDLALQPTTLDAWHVALFGGVLLLSITLIIVLILWVLTLVGRKPQAIAPSEPVIVEKIVEVEKEVEKIVEVEKVVEKIVPGPAPQPVILK